MYVTDQQYARVGMLDMSQRGAITLDRERMYWHGHNTPPLDRMIRVDSVVQPNIFIHVSLMVMAFLGLVLASAFLVVNIKYSDHRYCIDASDRLRCKCSSGFVTRLNI